MLSRVTARVLLDSAKNRAFFGSALFSGTPNRQNYESSPTIPPAFQSHNSFEAIKIPVEQKPHEEEIADQIQKIFIQVPRLIYEEIGDSSKEGGTMSSIWISKRPFRLHNGSRHCQTRSIKHSKRIWKALELFEQEKVSSYRVQEFLLQDSGQCSICSLDDLVHSRSFKSFYDHDNFVEANGCLLPIILQLLRDVVSELVVLHAMRIVHGGVNPKNVLILKGQRLFAKLVNCDRKAVEQLHHGNKTLAADLYGLGRVIGFCISEGGRPFGDVLAPSHKVILEKKINLSQAKYLPEAFHLICNLLMTPQDTRVKAIDILYHPLFWSPKKRVSFLYRVYKKLRYEIRNPYSRAIRGAISPYVMKETWAEEIGLFRLCCTSYKGLQKSLQYLRHTNVYYMAEPTFRSQPPEDFEPFNDAEAPLYRIVDDYYSRHYPWLLVYLYAVAQRSGEFDEFLSRL